MNEKYTQLGKVKTANTRNVVISKFNGDGYTLSQQIEVDEGAATPTTIFMKGTFHIATLENLVALRDMLTDVIEDQKE